MPHERGTVESAAIALSTIRLASGVDGAGIANSAAAGVDCAVAAAVAGVDIELARARVRVVGGVAVIVAFGCTTLNNEQGTTSTDDLLRLAGLAFSSMTPSIDRACNERTGAGSV